jgi:hypothetical protein
MEINGKLDTLPVDIFFYFTLFLDWNSIWIMRVVCKKYKNILDRPKIFSLFLPIRSKYICLINDLKRECLISFDQDTKTQIFVLYLHDIKEMIENNIVNVKGVKDLNIFYCQIIGGVNTTHIEVKTTTKIDNLDANTKSIEWNKIQKKMEVVDRSPSRLRTLKIYKEDLTNKLKLFLELKDAIN